MTASRRISYYPRAYWTMVEQIVEQNETYEMDFPTELQAQKWRGQFYGFQGALRAAALDADMEASLALPGTEEKIAAAKLVPLADKVMAQIIANPANNCWTVRLTHREDSWQVKAIGSARRIKGTISAEVAAEVEEINRGLAARLGLPPPGSAAPPDAPGGPSEAPETEEQKARRERLEKYGFIAPKG